MHCILYTFNCIYLANLDVYRTAIHSILQSISTIFLHRLSVSKSRFSEIPQEKKYDQLIVIISKAQNVLQKL